MDLAYYLLLMSKMCSFLCMFEFEFFSLFVFVSKAFARPKIQGLGNPSHKGAHSEGGKFWIFETGFKQIDDHFTDKSVLWPWFFLNISYRTGTFWFYKRDVSLCLQKLRNYEVLKRKSGDFLRIIKFKSSVFCFIAEVFKKWFFLVFKLKCFPQTLNDFSMVSRQLCFYSCGILTPKRCSLEKGSVKKYIFS